MPNFQGAVNRVLGMAGALKKIGGKKPSSLEEQQELAMKKVSEKAQAKKTQRRNFMDYLKKQPVSLGGTSSGTVGDLPKPLQKQIASQYTKSQRKTMMDRMDKEAKNGKQ